MGGSDYRCPELEPRVQALTQVTLSSSRASLLSWEGASDLKLGIMEVGSGGPEMEEAGVQRGLGKGKEMYKMVKFIK